jgi:glycosyltransferase involved in cell wall biosynthesis
VTVHNGIDVRVAAGAGPALRSELGLAPDDVILGMVSALRPEKSHDVAIEAVRLLRERFPAVRLLVVGDGAARQEVERLAAPLGDAVVLAGARADVMDVFDALDLCVHPSRADAFPTTLLEAMAASVPVVATAVGGIPEIVEDGVTGVLVDAPPSARRVADAVAALIRDPERRNALAAAGRARYEKLFTARPWAERTRAVYDAVLAERTGLAGAAVDA